MPLEKANAIVLRVVAWSETSSVVTLFTREFGQVRAVAKGARRPKGPFESALDVLSRCRIVLIRKSSHALDVLTEAKLLRRFRPAERKLSCLYSGYYVAELLSELTTEGDPHPALFDAADTTLETLSRGVDAAEQTLRFELTALRELGFLPSFSRCVECGESLRPPGRVTFGLLDGGVLCAACRQGKRQVVSISPQGWRTLQTMADGADLHSGDETLDRKVSGELRGVMNRYLAHLIGHKTRMHDYLGGA